VPLGSVLGQILFVIFINDIDSVCRGRTNMKLFADDAKLCSEIDLNDGSAVMGSKLFFSSLTKTIFQLKNVVKRLVCNFF